MEIGRNLTEAARQTGTTFTVVSRSDSTPRSHFPGEVEALDNSFSCEEPTLAHYLTVTGSDMIHSGKIHSID